MLTLSQSRRQRGEAGIALPGNFPQLKAEGFEFRRGNFCLIAAGPGTGKSLIALNLALRSMCRSLYFSADSDQATQWTRAASIVTDTDYETVTEDLLSNSTAKYDAVLDRLPRMRINYSPNPKTDELEEEIYAYHAVYDHFPELIVMDNLLDLEVEHVEGTGSHQALDEATSFLNSIARKTQAAVVSLHHVNGPHVNGTDPIPLNGLRGQPGRVAQQIITVHRQEYPDMLNMSIVKNRGGKANAGGTYIVQVPVNFRTMRVG